MNFQVTILKVLVSYPDGFASLDDLKRDVATCGKDWSERTEIGLKGEGIVHEAVSAYGGINPFDERVCSGRL
jgi:hypothetical protein